MLADSTAHTPVLRSDVGEASDGAEGTIGAATTERELEDRALSLWIFSGQSYFVFVAAVANLQLYTNSKFQSLQTPNSKLQIPKSPNSKLHASCTRSLTMPARRQFRRPRRRAPRRKSTAVKALVLARRAWNATDHELKFIDGAFTNQDIVEPSTAVFAAVNVLLEGSSQSERIGIRCKFEHIDMRFVFRKAANNTLDASVIRFMLIWDKQNNSALATVANVLQLIGTGSSYRDLSSPLRVQNSKRFTILKDVTFPLVEGQSTFKTVHWRTRINKVTQYNGAGAAIGQISTGALLIGIFSDIAAGGALPTVDGTTRLVFVG